MMEGLVKVLHVNQRHGCKALWAFHLRPPLSIRMISSLPSITLLVLLFHSFPLPTIWNTVLLGI
jgi:hypothetical protein